MGKYSILTVLFVMAAIAVSGCFDPETRTKEMRDCPTMKAAVDAERRGDVNTAIECYVKVASMYPDEPMPYLQLALLLQEHKNDYLGAIYNYRRFIDNAKTFNDRQELTAISNRINKAKLCVAQELLRTISSSSASPEVRAFQDFTNLNRELEKYKKQISEKDETILLKDKEIRRLMNEVFSKQLVIDKMKESISSDKIKQSSDELESIWEDDEKLYTGPNGETYRLYKVKSNDNLSRIANSVYHNASMWPRISTANSDKIDKSNTVKAGDVLLIPWP